MLSEKIEAQEFSLKILKGHLKEGRLAHSYLLVGNDPATQQDLAMAFACALNCEKENYFRDCGCASCHKILEHNHPDVFWVRPEQGKQTIKIEAVREVMGQASLKPYEGKWKVFVIDPADGLTLEAANAFLKTLEEPPFQTLFLLLVESKAHLLDTIISRSFEVRLRPVASVREDKLEALKLTLAAYRTKSWDDFLQTLPAKTRDDLSQSFLLVSELVTKILHEKTSTKDAGVELKSWLRAIDYLLESKEAVDGNVNQKLALTRTAMQLEKCLPLRSVAA